MLLAKTMLATDCTVVLALHTHSNIAVKRLLHVLLIMLTLRSLSSAPRFFSPTPAELCLSQQNGNTPTVTPAHLVVTGRHFWLWGVPPGGYKTLGTDSWEVVVALSSASKRQHPVTKANILSLRPTNPRAFDPLVPGVFVDVFKCCWHCCHIRWKVPEPFPTWMNDRWRIILSGRFR